MHSAQKQSSKKGVGIKSVNLLTYVFEATVVNLFSCNTRTVGRTS